MNPGYETVVDPSTIIWTLSAMLIHGGMIALQVGLIGFLIGTGLLGSLAPDFDRPWLRRLGAVNPHTGTGRHLAVVRIALGAALLLPLALGAPFLISLAASLGTIALLISVERSLSGDAIRPGRWARHTAIASAALVAAFMLWESEDGLALGTELIATAQGWRMHELEWQLANDTKTPKVGDMAPDFELQDPSGKAAVRLSDFRGKRPVALVFGSYT
jgi:hypothetical protein